MGAWFLDRGAEADLPHRAAMRRDETRGSGAITLKKVLAPAARFASGESVRARAVRILRYHFGRKITKSVTALTVGLSG
jgi:hypothetical protein